MRDALKGGLADYIMQMDPLLRMHTTVLLWTGIKLSRGGKRPLKLFRSHIR